MEKEILGIARKAREASRSVAVLSTERKNAALKRIGSFVREYADDILSENAKDIENAEKFSLSSALVDRLVINEERIENMLTGLHDIIALPDPVGAIEDFKTLPNGLQTGKMRVPVGVIGIIYESRPNVTLDTSALCIKSGNAIILKGGSEAYHSNLALVRAIRDGLQAEGLSADIVQYLEYRERKAVSYLLKQDAYIDIIIPRGGPNLIRKVVEDSTIPVIKHDAGVCHLYVDKEVDIEMALNIVLNSKVQRPGVCNALECLLVHQAVASDFLPPLVERLKKEGVEVRGCLKSKELVNIKEAGDDDWGREYLDKILALKMVENYEEAVSFIARYSSQHTDGILTSNYSQAMRFVKEIDSSAVTVNASTRFNDGGQLGFGAEMGISTQKLHVRGPMGLKDLCCTKNIILGDGQIRG